jgi:UDP-arabinose 4-epimerase
MKSVLVTGGAGYVGSHTCKALRAAGYLPITYDNLVAGHNRAVKWGPLEVGDIADRGQLNAVLTEYRPEAVLHFAAHVAAGESVTDPGKYYRNNVAGTLSLLEALCVAGPTQMVFSSTAAVYGDPDNSAISEDHPLNPINPYGKSKLMIEEILRDFEAAHGMRSVCLRYFNAAGADPDGEVGEAHVPKTHLIPLVLEAAFGRRSHVDIYGDDYDTPDGTCVRDYVHVSDLADAHVAALERLFGGGESVALNLGTGQGHSVRRVIETVSQTVGRAIPERIVARRHGDPAILVADPSRAQELLKWTLNYPGLEEIVATAAAWAESVPVATDTL